MAAEVLFTSSGKVQVIFVFIVNIFGNQIDLAKFSGRARFAYAIGGAVGTWGGWLGSAHWQILAVVALVLCAGFIPLLKAMPGPVRH